jgi:HlyD family secretion protein
MRRWFWLVAVLVTAGAMALWNAGRAPSYRYVAEPVTRGDLVQVVTATGTVLPRNTVEVGSQLSGQIRELLADYNDRVTQGQVIARLDPSEFAVKVQEVSAELETARTTRQLRQQEVERARTDLANARAKVAVLAARRAAAAEEASLKAKEFARQQKLADRRAGSLKDKEGAAAALGIAKANLAAAEAELRMQESSVSGDAVAVDMAGTRVEAARSVVAEATARLAAARLALERTEIRAPIDGIVIRRDVSVGQTVAASLQAPTLFSIAQDLSRVRVETNVDEADIGRVETGQYAIFAVEAFPGKTFRGRVERIRKSPQRIQNVVTYIVEIDAENPDRKLFPGITALVRIAVADASGVLTVPNAALRFSPPEQAGAQQTQGAGVWINEAGGALRRIAVKTGITDSLRTEVTGDQLADGQAVIVSAERIGGAG